MKLRKLLLTAAAGVALAAPIMGAATAKSTAVPASTVTFDGGNCSATFVRSSSGIINETDRTCDFGTFDGEDVVLQFRPTNVKTPNPACGPNVIVAPFTFTNSETSLAGYFVGNTVYNVCVYLADDTVEGTIPVGDIAGTDVTLPLAGDYRIDVIGTWTNGGVSVGDAEYNLPAGDSTWIDGYPGIGPDFGDVMVNGAFVNWGAYDGVSHRYSTTVTDVSSVNLALFDGANGVANPSWYGDNTNDLTYVVTFLGL